MLGGGDGLVDGGDAFLVVLIRRWVDGVVDAVKVIANTGYTVVIVIVVLLMITIGIATTTILISKRSRSIAYVLMIE